MSDLGHFTDAEMHAELRRRHEAGDVKKREAALGLARDMILKAAGYTCIHDPNPTCSYGYCSHCPVSPIQRGGDYQALRLICGRDTRYGK